LMSSQFNVLRKLFHFSGVIFIAAYYSDIFKKFPEPLFNENTRSVLFYLILAGFLIMALVEFLRFRYPFFQKTFLQITGKIIKPSEVNKMHGSLPFFLGLLICTALYMKEVTIISALFLMVGDPCAAWFGGKYGSHKLYNGKSFEGFIAGIAGAFFSGLFFLVLNWKINPGSFFAVLFEDHFILLSVIVFAGAFLGLALELFSASGFFDDNLLIPSISGLAMSLMLWIAFKIPIESVFYSLNHLLFSIK